MSYHFSNQQIKFKLKFQFVSEKSHYWDTFITKLIISILEAGACLMKHK